MDDSEKFMEGNSQETAEATETVVEAVETSEVQGEAAETVVETSEAQGEQEATPAEAPQTQENAQGYFYDVKVDEEDEDEDNVSEPQFKDKKSSTILIVSVICLLLAVGVILFFVLRDKGDDKAATTDDTAQTTQTDAGTDTETAAPAQSAADTQAPEEPIEYEDYGVTVEVGDYRNLTLEFPEIEITDDEIGYELDSFVESFAEYIDVTDRPAQLGDTLLVDYDGVVDGEHHDETTGTDLEVVLGSGRTIAGFEDGLVGTRVGDTVVLNLQFPEQYDEKFAGKPVEFTLKVNSVQCEVIPELTDEFVATNTDYKTVDEFREATREDLQSEAEAEAEEDLLDTAVRQLIEMSTFGGGIEDEIADRQKYLMNYYDSYFMSMIGVDAKTYYSMSDEEYDDLMHSVAEFEAKRPYVLSAIAEGEGYVPTEEEKAAKFEEIFYDVYGFASEEEVYKSFTKELCDISVLNELTAQYGQQWLSDNLKVTGRPE